MSAVRHLRLKHRSKLGLARHDRLLPRLTTAELAGAPLTVSFRRPSETLPCRTRTVDATCRLCDVTAPHLRLLHLESDSPLAPLLIWDIAHAAPLGGRIEIIEDKAGACPLQRSYFAPAFAVVAQGPGRWLLEKTAPLPAERDAGLDDWTFGIPVGPGDPTMLNGVVRRILDLPIANKEIILCGRPPAGFKHFDAVRIIGEDIPAPPVRIATKKNLIATEARFGNICIMHDRVILPADFLAAIRRFGDLYPFQGFQSLYFDDLWQAAPIRYSDYMHVDRMTQTDMHATPRPGSPDPVSPIAPHLLAYYDRRNRFRFENPLRYTSHSYLTGSLYITKKSVWAHCPQNPALYWLEYEDVDHGERCAAAGIPHRINPYALTQSVISRSVMNWQGTVSYLTAAGRPRTIRFPFFRAPLPRKPLLKLSFAEARQRVRAFAEKYAPHLLTWQPFAGLLPRLDRMKDRTRLALGLVHAAELPRTADAVQAFVDDFERLILADQFTYDANASLVADLMQAGSPAKARLVWTPAYLNQIYHRPGKRIFYEAPHDFFLEPGVASLVGTTLTALTLALQNGRALYHPDGFTGFLRAIRATTPSRSLLR